MPWRMQITPPHIHIHKLTHVCTHSPPPRSNTHIHILRQADVWQQYAPGGPQPQLQLPFQLEQMSPISPAQILSSHTHSLISTMTPVWGRQTRTHLCWIYHTDNMQCSCKRHQLGMKDRHGQGCSAICIITHASSRRCILYTHSQHVNIICHTNTHSEYENDVPVFPYVWLPCFSVSVIMLFPNKQMPSFIRHLQQQLYRLSTINIFAAGDVLQWI